MDLTSTIEADSTQVNADELAAPRTVTITGVNKGTADQPVNIELAELPGKAYRPCKSMRRVLVAAWGSDATQYIGRRLTIFNDQSVKWGGAAIGGVRISHMSHIDKPLTLALTETRGKRKPYRVEPLKDAPVESKPPAITPEAVAEFERDIASASTVEELNAVGADLKAWDLGSHQNKLQSAWRDRSKALKAAAPESTEPQQGELS